jgi:hypothetical protein
LATGRVLGTEAEGDGEGEGRERMEKAEENAVEAIGSSRGFASGVRRRRRREQWRGIR